MSTTFAVSPVERGSDRLPTVDTRHALAALLGQELQIEACSEHALLDEPVTGWRWHPLIAAVDCAFNRHLPLMLSPDDIWLCIAQAIACQVRDDAPPVSAHGKQRLEVRFDEFVPGSPNNPWPRIFDGFVEAIGVHDPKGCQRIMAEFSTTTEIERAAFAVTLMDAMQDYYSYVGTSLCGIPEITLLGDPQDFRQLCERARACVGVGPEGWSDALTRVCEKLLAAAEGNPDPAFFQSLYKLNSFSGGPYMNGWINVLFPYTWNYREERFSSENRASVRWQWANAMDEFGAGGKPKATPLGLSRAPLLWRIEHPPAEHRYELIAGFVGVSQDPTTLAVRPTIGWAAHQN